MSSASPVDLRIEHPDVAFELETTALEQELVNELFYIGSIWSGVKEASITVELSGNHKLIVAPMVRSYGGYPVWSKAIIQFDPRTCETKTRHRYQVHVVLRKGDAIENLIEFEVEATSLERIVAKALARIQKICNKRLAVQLVEDV